MALIDNIVNYWKLDESSGNIADSAGSSPGTNVNTVTFSNTNPLINNYAHFVAASNQQFNFTPDGDSATGNGARTIAMWVKLTTYTAASDTYVLFECGNDAANENTIFQITPGSASAGRLSLDKYGAAYESTSAASLSTATWYHLAVTYDGAGNIKFYKDGSQLGSTVGSASFSTNNVQGTLASRRIGTTQDLNGDMDEVGYWARELTSTEISQLYNSGAGLAYPFGSSENTDGNFFMFMDRR